MADYKGDSDDNIQNENKKVNYLDNNNEDGMEYVITVYLSNESFIHLLTA